MTTYKVATLSPRLFSGTLDPTKLQALLNEHAAEGWSFSRSIHVSKRVWLLFSRSVHFVVFERDGEGS